MPEVVTVFINGRGHAVEPGLVSGSRLRELAGVGDDEVIALIREEGANTPILATEVVLLRGDEKFAGMDPDDVPATDAPSHVTPEFNGARGLRVEGGKATAQHLVGQDDTVSCGRLFAVLAESADEGLDVEIPGDATIVVQATDSYFVVPHPADELDEIFVDIEECTKHERRPPRWHRYRIVVDGDKFVIEKRWMSGEDILALVNKRPDEWALNQKLRGGRRIRIKAHEEVDLADPGVERFETVPRQAQQG